MKYQSLTHRLCPHWHREVKVWRQPIMFRIHRKEKCVICGHQRWEVTLPPVHPARDQDEVLQWSRKRGVEFVEVGERTEEVADFDG